MSEEVKEQEVKETAEVEATEQVAADLSLPVVFGIKKGMSAIFTDAGKRIPVTVLECKPWTVTQVKTEKTDGYNAVQVSYGNKKAKNSTKAEIGKVKASGGETGFRYSREVRCDIPEGCEPGKLATVSSIAQGEKVQVTAKAKGRGFSGVVKRYGFGGGPATHGSGFHRRPGSMGNCTFPGRIMAGKKMPGQYGNKNITMKGLEIVGVNVEENVLLIKGSVPGAVNTLVKISRRG